MPPSYARRPSAALLLIVAVACSVHMGSRNPSGSGFPPSRPGIDPDAPHLPTTDPRTFSADVQRSCRGSNLSATWVIVDYFVSDECPGLGAERYNGARIVRHAQYPLDAEIVVCADQGVPKGWRRLKLAGEDTDLQLLCRSSVRDRPVSDRLMRIRRQ